ncbi:MAG: glycosyltransferase family 4 protein [Desulfobacteraceae bacterium]|nr:glycosyltransferase family 4 protein [Desulfobacteraceae bacterium]
MKIAIDSRALMNPPAGVANYLMTAINEISAQNPSWLLYLLVNRDLHKEAQNRIKERGNVIIVKNPLRILGGIGILWYAVKMYFILKQLKPDWFWAPANVLPPMVPEGIRTVVTVQDLVSKQYANTMMLVDRFYYSVFFNRSVNNAEILWTLSNYTKNELERNYPNRKCQDILVGECIDKQLFHKKNISAKEKRGILGRLGIGEKFILFVGTIEPRKNLKFLISLMPELTRDDFSLLIVGAKGWGDSEIDEILNSRDFPRDRVVFSGFLNTEELVKIYNIASLLVLPSINEGFGLPAAEAMCCGCPVVAADNSGLREVVQNGGLLVSGWNKGNWIDGIRRVYKKRDMFVKSGLEKAGEYDLANSIERFSKRCEFK